MLRRPRRNRKSATIRAMVQETTLSTDHLIFPLFMTEGQNKRVEIASMPGIGRLSPDRLLDEIHQCLELGIRTFALFPQIDESLKDSHARESHNPEGLYLRTIRQIKTQLPEANLMTDVAMDPYSSDGHDGLVRERPDPQRRDARHPGQDGPGAGPGRRRHHRALRHDGRPRGLHPPTARRGRLYGRVDHVATRPSTPAPSTAPSATPSTRPPRSATRKPTR